MVKRLLSTFLQFIAFCVLFYVGGFWAEVRLALELRALEHQTSPLPMLPLWKVQVNPHLEYVLNGLVFALALLVLILLIQAIRKRVRSHSGWTLLAFVLAFLLSLLVHSGFVPLTPGA
jgi:hypothetical protein